MMTKHLPSSILEVVAAAWGIADQAEQRVFYEELHHDWILWEREAAGKAGGRRLIVPKYGSTWFEIGSAAYASNADGISYEYDIEIQSCAHPTHAAAKILAAHTTLSPVQAFKALRAAPVQIERQYLARPLRLMRELQTHDAAVRLIRPEGHGEYNPFQS